MKQIEKQVTEYIVRNTSNGGPIQIFINEYQAVKFTNMINKKHNAEVAEVVKSVTTIVEEIMTGQEFLQS